jgi:hypothetical protein
VARLIFVMLRRGAACISAAYVTPRLDAKSCNRKTYSSNNQLVHGNGTEVASLKNSPGTCPAGSQASWILHKNHYTSPQRTRHA